MTYKKIKLTTFVTAAVVSVMQIATAQTQTAEEGIPYEIVFSGTFYPSGLESIEYPFSAASDQQDGECTLSITTNALEEVTAMSVQTCTHTTFETAARNFIESQPLAALTSNEAHAHTLHIYWSIGAETLTAEPIEIASR